jgi:NAD(P)-dependent dehydrogenase (short-subunit alcohol dehydrogenase family)
MIDLSAIRSSLTAFSSQTQTFPSPYPVAVFVGGTSGIGAAAAKSLAAYTSQPRIYIIGRNEAAAEEIIAECTAANPNAQSEFLKQDVSLLRDVDTVCAKIVKREQRIDLLVMSQGYLSTRGRNGTLSPRLAEEYK